MRNEGVIFEAYEEVPNFQFVGEKNGNISKKVCENGCSWGVDARVGNRGKDFT